MDAAIVAIYGEVDFLKDAQKTVLNGFIFIFVLVLCFGKNVVQR